MINLEALSGVPRPKLLVTHPGRGNKLLQTFLGINIPNEPDETWIHSLNRFVLATDSGFKDALSEVMGRKMSFLDIYQFRFLRPIFGTGEMGALFFVPWNNIWLRPYRDKIKGAFVLIHENLHAYTFQTLPKLPDANSDYETLLAYRFCFEGIANWGALEVLTRVGMIAPRQLNSRDQSIVLAKGREGKGREGLSQLYQEKLDPYLADLYGDADELLTPETIDRINQCSDNLGHEFVELVVGYLGANNEMTRVQSLNHMIANLPTKREELKNPLVYAQRL